MISQLDSYQKKRRRNAWFTFGAVLIGWAVLSYLDKMSDQVAGMITVLLVITLGNAFRVQFQLSDEDKLLDLLRRYINRDAEAIKRMSTAKSREADSTSI